MRQALTATAVAFLLACSGGERGNPATHQPVATNNETIAAGFRDALQRTLPYINEDVSELSNALQGVATSLADNDVRTLAPRLSRARQELDSLESQALLEPIRALLDQTEELVARN